jgi:hypothetical protein
VSRLKGIEAAASTAEARLVPTSEQTMHATVGRGQQCRPDRLPLAGAVAMGLHRLHPPQRAHHHRQHPELVHRIAGVKLSAPDPRRRALAPQGEFAVGFGDLLSQGNHGLFLSCSR